jgi:glycosyltransferase involved in cell wall biosynthesis
VKPLHIVYIGQYFPPEMGAPAARAYEYGRRWVAAGHRVTMICGIPNHPTGVVHDGYRKQWRRVETIDGIDVHRMWVYVTPNSGKLRRSLNYLSFCCTALMEALRLREVDVCIASTPQMFAGLAGVLYRILRKRPLILEVRDLWPDSIEAVQVGMGAWILAGLRRIERMMYRRSDRIVIVSPAFRSHIEACGVAPERIAIMPNGVSTALFTRRERGKRHMLKDFGNAFVAAYIGTLGLAHALETAIDAMRLLRDEKDIQLVLIGEGAQKTALKRYAADLDNVTFLDQMPREDIAVLLGEIDVGLVLLRDTPLFRTVIPSKMFEMMGAGLPIILAVQGQAREILDSAGAGIVIDAESPAQLAQAILTLRRDSDFAARCGENAFRHVRAHYDLDMLALAYLDTIRSVL